MQLTQIIRCAAQSNPRGLSTRHAGRVWTWAETVARVARLAGGLTALGLQPGERVGILALNGDRFFETVFAVSWAGGVFQPGNLRLAPAEIADQLIDSEARFLLVDDAGVKLVAGLGAEIGAVEHRIYLGEGATPPGHIAYATLEAGTPGRASPRSDDDLAALFYTGGTTGRAKGVMLSHRNLVATSVITLATLPLESSDLYCHALPMFHIAASLAMFGYSQAAAGHCFQPKFDPLDWLTMVSELKVTRTGLAPTMIKMVLDHPRFAEFDLSSLIRLSYGAAPIPEPLLEAALTRMPSVGFAQGYGQTECSGLIARLSHKRHVTQGPLAGKLRSAGQPVPGVEVVILDPNGQPLPIGAVGEICLAGDNVMLGYWNRPDETAAALAGGWLHTGDAGYIDEDGFIFIVDRVKDMIVTGGENVFCGEVESVLCRHPAVSECAVIGIPHAQWGEQVHAVIRLRDGMAVDEADLIAHAASLIARYKCPKSISFRTEPMPLSGVGKVLKTSLRAPFWAGQSRNVN